MAVLATTPPTAPKFGKSPLLSGISSRMLLLAGLVAVLPLIAIAIANVYIIQLIDPRLSATGNLGTLIAVDAVALVISISAIVAAVMATARSVTRPVMATASLAESVGRGNLDVAVAPSSRNDQLDMMVRSINDMVGYVREMAAVADRVATGDLTVQVDPRSDSDVFGMAFRRMIQATHRVAADVMQDARAVADATDSLYRASTQAMEAASKIASSVDVSNTRTVEESEMIARIAQGAEDQRRSVLSSSDTISQMSSAIERVAQNAQAVADASGSAYRAATDGAERVKQAAISM
ncbi:MAG TPA: methyl-accepting chemotaxis protein, partial [Chloroflexota bacterium]|nr:methyl-accepting chemotaxis protein [Chloroflexota bacterium]